MYAIFENGGKQYKACEGDLVKVEKLNAEIGSTVEFPVVMTVNESGISVAGDVADVRLTAEVVAQGKDKKIIVFKYKPKKNERKKQGHRQPYTLVKVTAIGQAAEKAKAEKPAAKKTAAKKTAAKAKATEVAAE